MSPSKAPKKKVGVPRTDISKKESKSTRNFVFAMVGLTVVVVLVGGAVLYWLIGQYVKQTNKNKSQDITIGLLEKKTKDLAALKPNYEKIIADGANGRSDADLILSAMPEEQAYDSLIAMIERMGQEAGVKVSTISQSKKDKSAGSGASSYQVSVALEGTFQGIMDFLGKTEKSSRVMDFVSMNIGASTGGQKSSANITFDAYYQKTADINPTTKELE